MITEDYVSFETAKLLKEREFDELGDYYYTKNGEFTDCLTIGYVNGGDQVICKNHTLFPYKAPTLQMAMKWLREVHNLSVEVYRTACGYIGCIVAIPSGTDIKFLEEDGDDLPSGTYTKWEYACEAAIKYCLENLI